MGAGHIVFAIHLSVRTVRMVAGGWPLDLNVSHHSVSHLNLLYQYNFWPLSLGSSLRALSAVLI